MQKLSQPASADKPRPIITRDAAMRLKIARYYTGEPCKRGHYAERYTCANSRSGGACIECQRMFREDPSTREKHRAHVRRSRKSVPHFVTWLSEQAHRADMVGDLAREYVRQCRKRGVPRFDMQVLVPQLYGPAREAFDMARREYFESLAVRK